MNIFYIDTSSSYLYAGISINNYLVSYIKEDLGKELSTYALNKVSEMFKEAKLNPKDIDKIIVVSGPGSFTGIRVGLTIAKIMAWALKKDITSISSLESMSTSVLTDKLKVPVIDARRGYVYAAVYKQDKEILEKQYIKLDDLISYLKKTNENYTFITNDDKFKVLDPRAYNPNILKIIEKFQDKKNENPHMIEPIYLKLTEAEENLGKQSNDNANNN